MTIRQAYQILGLSGWENLDEIEKKFCELNNDTRIRLTNEFDDRRKAELIKYSAEIQEACEVLHRIPSAVPCVKQEPADKLPQSTVTQLQATGSTRRSMSFRMYRSRAIAVSVAIHIILIALVGWRLYNPNENNQKEVLTKEKASKPPEKNNQQKGEKPAPKPTQSHSSINNPRSIRQSPEEKRQDFGRYFNQKP